MEFKIPFSLDPEGFLRRQCPLCGRQFKIKPHREGSALDAGEPEDTFLLSVEGEGKVKEDLETSTELFCPYCGQPSPGKEFLTDAQKEYIHSIIGKHIARLVGDNLFQSLKKIESHSSGSISIKAESKKIPEPGIPPLADVGDLQIYHLSCCEKEIKIQEGWEKPVYCPYCGFMHKKLLPRD